MTCLAIAGAMARTRAAAAPRILSFIMPSLILLLLDERRASRWRFRFYSKERFKSLRLLSGCEFDRSRSIADIDQRADQSQLMSRCTNSTVWKFASKTASDIEFDRHVLRPNAGERQPLDEPFAHLADASVVVDPHRQEVAPTLIGLAPYRHAGGNGDRGRLQDFVHAEIRVLRDRGP